MTVKENVITKIYDLLLYLIPQLGKFPRDQKFILADRIETALLDLLEDMIEAYYGKEKRLVLRRGNVRLEKIRYLIRLSHDLKILGGRRYIYVSERVDEIGKMIGGWERSLVRVS